MFYVGVAFLVFLSLGGLLYLRRYFWSLREGRPLRALQDQFAPVDIIIALLFVAFWTLAIWQQLHMPHTVVTASGAVMSAILYLFFVIMIIGALIGRGCNPSAIFGLRWSGWRQNLPPCWLALLAVYPAIILVTMIVQHMLGPNVAAQEVVEFLKHSTSWKDRAIVSLAAIICAPICEEVIFRGYFYGMARQYLGRWVAVLATAALFAAIHVNLPSLAGLFLFAILLTLVYEKTGSLWAPITLHATFNIVTVTITLLYPDLPS